MDGIARKYVALLFATDQIVKEDLVDWSYGSAEEIGSLAPHLFTEEIMEELMKLSGLLDANMCSGQSSIEHLRAVYLKEHVVALWHLLDLHQNPTWKGPERCLKTLYGGLRWERLSDDILQKNLRQIGEVLGASGERAIHHEFARIKAKTTLEGDRAVRMVTAMTEDVRQMAVVKMGFVDTGVTVEGVHDQPWTGYNVYKGDGVSDIKVNLSPKPITLRYALTLAAHEGAMGHHGMACLQQKDLVDGRGWVEYSVGAMFMPSTAVNEGLAELGTDVAFPTREAKRAFFLKHGATEAEIEATCMLMDAEEPLEMNSLEIYFRFLNKEIDEGEAAALLRRYVPGTKEVSKFVKTYGAYVYSYRLGYELAKKANPELSWQRHWRLQGTPRVPSTMCEP